MLQIIVQFQHLTPFFKNIIVEEQHGFVGGKSTITNLTIFKNFLSDSLDRGVQVDVIYTDFSKAFDQVDHSILLNKLKYYGIDGSIFSWMKSYLTDHTQAVILQGVESDVIEVTSGVPQGSHLGPLLFSIFMNDFVNNIKYCMSLLFADDA